MKLIHLFKHTAFYGLVTILPRLLNLILTPLHIGNFENSQYGIYQGIFAYFILGNVLLTYGMETAFFRFSNKHSSGREVGATASLSLLISTCLFLILGFLAITQLSQWTGYPIPFLRYGLLILSLDTLCVIPFAWLRYKQQSEKYAWIKSVNIFINLGLNLFFFLILNSLPDNIFLKWIKSFDSVHYVFISNLIASAITWLMLSKLIFQIGFRFDWNLWKKMFNYALPILISGIAFSINEAFDRIFIQKFNPPTIANAQVGIYSACYKMGVFMTLFITAYKLGIEPFFFSTSSDKNASKIYALLTKLLIIFGGFILILVSIYTDIFKQFLIPNTTYWEALWIVPFILLANLCLGIYHSLSIWYKVTDQTKYGAYISIGGAIVTLLTNFILVPIMGYKGAAIATLLAYALMMITSFILGQRFYPIDYDIKRISLYLSLSIIISFLNFYTLNRNLLYGTIGLILYILVIISYEKKTLYPLCNNIRKFLLKKSNH